MNLKQVVLGLAIIASTSLSALAQCKTQIWPADKAKPKSVLPFLAMLLNKDTLEQPHLHCSG